MTTRENLMKMITNDEQYETLVVELLDKIFKDEAEAVVLLDAQAMLITKKLCSISGIDELWVALAMYGFQKAIIKMVERKLDEEKLS